uniref:Uncharacterized protein n=1 Tax=Arundo donax TaxID=35708 RepID=A0A0A9CW48_ARUDO
MHIPFPTISTNSNLCTVIHVQRALLIQCHLILEVHLLH